MSRDLHAITRLALLGALCLVLAGAVAAAASAAPATDATGDAEAGSTATPTGAAATQHASNDTAVVWRGFRHAWSYNHRFNRFGSWVDMQDCDGESCEYEVGHSAASGTGEDVAATRDAYTELSTRGVTFHDGSITLDLDGTEKRAGPVDQAFTEDETVTIPFEGNSELRDRDDYVALLNGMDVVSHGSAAKLIDFELNASEVTVTNDGLEFDVEKHVRMDCDSFECDGLFGKGVQDVDYEIEVQYLVIAGDDDRFNVVYPGEFSSNQNWEACDNNGIGPNNSDGYVLTVVDNGFPGNHMWCENMPKQPLNGGIVPGGSDLNHGNYWRTDWIHGEDSPDSAGNQPVETGYSVGTVGIQGLSVNMPHESHFVQYDTVVGGSYHATEGRYDLRALPFFKEWSSRPGMYKDARYSYGFEGSATTAVRPVLLQIRDGCKRSFVSGSSVHWSGSDEVPTTSDAVTSDTYDFDHGATPYGYGNARGTYCEQPADPPDVSRQYEQEVPGTTLRWDDVFPIRDGYPPGVPGTSTGSRIDLWNELRSAQANDGEEPVVQDPTQLHGRPSDRFIDDDTDNRDAADLSEVNVTVYSGGERSSFGSGWATPPASSESVDLDNLPSVPGLESVYFEDHQLFLEDGGERIHVSVENENANYEMDASLVSAAAAEGDAVNGSFFIIEAPDPVRTGQVDDHSYALEIVLSCPDESCQPTTGTVPIHVGAELDPFEIQRHHNASEVQAASPRDDHDHYRFEVERAERVMRAGVEDAQGLELTLYDGATPLETVASGEDIDTTTTDVEGSYQLGVRGSGVVDEYTLNLTTQHISQKYEENDAKGDAHHFAPDLNTDEPRVELEEKYGNRQWCDASDSDPTGGGGGVSIGSQCPRHPWVESFSDSPGYSPEDPDWYSIAGNRGDRLNVDVEGDDLGIEIHEDGDVAASTNYSTDDPSLSHVLDSDGTVYVNVTGTSYNPTYDLELQWVFASGQDRFELNDEESTAELLVPGEGENVESFDDLQLAGDDEDYFEVYLEDGDDLNATIEHRETDYGTTLELVRPDGSVVEGTASTLRPNRKTASLVAQSDGEHYVRTASESHTALYYNLSVGTDKQSPAAVPGFGPLAALVALVLGAVLLGRRR